MPARKAKKQKQKNKKTHIRKNASLMEFANSKLFKQIFLVFLAAGSLFVLSALPVYENWLTERIFRYFRNFPGELSSTKTNEELFQERNPSDHAIIKALRNNLPDSAIVLLPSQKYIKKNFSKTAYLWAHSVWNYYVSGQGNYINYKDKKTDFSRATHAAFIRENEATADTSKSPIEIPNSRLWLGPILNEKGKKVEIHLAQINSPAVLESVLLEYRTNE